MDPRLRTPALDESFSNTGLRNIRLTGRTQPEKIFVAARQALNSSRRLKTQG